MVIARWLARLDKPPACSVQQARRLSRQERHHSRCQIGILPTWQPYEMTTTAENYEFRSRLRLSQVLLQQGHLRPRSCYNSCPTASHKPFVNKATHDANLVASHEHFTYSFLEYSVQVDLECPPGYLMDLMAPETRRNRHYTKLPSAAFSLSFFRAGTPGL